MDARILKEPAPGKVWFTKITGVGNQLPEKAGLEVAFHGTSIEALAKILNQGALTNATNVNSAPIRKFANKGQKPGVHCETVDRRDSVWQYTTHCSVRGCDPRVYFGVVLELLVDISCRVKERG